MWLEFTSLADAVEAIVIHDNLSVLGVVADDRIWDKSRYQAARTNIPMLSTWIEAGVVQQLEASDDLLGQARDWLESAARSPELLEQLLDSMITVLQQPVYRSIPDLFSYSQTIYKFDGESIWKEIKRSLGLRDFARKYQHAMRSSGFVPRLEYGRSFYAEDILGFFLRGLLYNDIAKAKGIPYRPHPARSFIAMCDGLWAVGISREYALAPIKFVMNLHDEIAKFENEGQDFQLFDLGLPPVFSAVLRECNSPQEIPQIALEIRNGGAARNFREWIASSYSAEKGLEVVKAQRELQELRRRLRLELGLDEKTVNVGLWKFSFPVRIPPWLLRPLYVGPRRHLQFIRELARASLDVMNQEKELLRVFG
jgi:hypothetical protein